jgi:hypothetical protein
MRALLASPVHREYEVHPKEDSLGSSAGSVLASPLRWLDVLVTSAHMAASDHAIIPVDASVVPSPFG